MGYKLIVNRVYKLIAYNKNMELREVFIDNIKKYRKQTKLSQMALAERCKTATSYIGEIEIGKKFPSIDMIQKIADALGVPPYKLFMGKDEMYIAGLSPERKKELIIKLQQAVADIINSEKASE